MANHPHAVPTVDDELGTSPLAHSIPPFSISRLDKRRPLLPINDTLGPTNASPRPWVHDALN